MKVSLFIPCLVDAFLPDVGEAVAALMHRLGMNLVYHEEQTCCGRPAFTDGHHQTAAKLAKRFISVFENDEVVVSPSGTCVHMVRSGYPELLTDEPDWLRRAEDLAGRVYEFSEFLVDVLKVEDVGAEFSGKVAYHESCILSRGLGVLEQPRKLIQAVKGTELTPLERADECCGFGGKFSVDYADISLALVKDKAERFIASEADVLVMSEPGCLLNISGYMHRNHPGSRAMHLASFLTGQA